jgi:hypothetical protein
MSEHRKSFRIKITHETFGECLGQTRNLSTTGVYVKHPGLSSLPRVRMEVVLVDADGIGLRYL